MLRKHSVIGLFFFLFLTLSITGCASDRVGKRQAELDKLQEKFSWWPTDASPKPVKDAARRGYWWWPAQPGQAKPWGNRGYVYVYKIIFDYMEDELPPAKPNELRASLLIKKIIKNVKVYFDFDKATLRDDAKKILAKAVATLERNPESSILITGNCDVRGSENYNEKLGRRRADAVKKFMLDSDVQEDKIKIVSRGKLDAVAPVTDLVGMQKDRNAQFMIAEVEELMIPAGEELPASAQKIDERRFVTEEEVKVESQVKVATREYIVQKNDTLWKIAKRELGSAHRWKYLYEVNKDRIKGASKLRVGQKLLIPVE
ncbi:MAG: OmpA family protein [Candidatus Omnitrophica bacterium]|nr:OmpA family protein [Candidatus Omnitrophota bacterium]